MKNRFPLLCLAAVALALTSGCANVKPWQRGTLADYTMRADRDPVGEAEIEHVYFSREMASGGQGVGGGGCGCN
jgi:type IV pilus biogenesis protein CpaD/CtpE